MGARGWLRVNRVGINFRLNIRGRVLAAISSADGSLDVADSAVEAIAADISGATWIDLPDGALGLSAMTLSRDDQFRGRALAETVRYEVALGVLAARPRII